MSVVGAIEIGNTDVEIKLEVTWKEEMKNDKSVLEISDFRELGYEYLNYVGDGNFVRCSECKRLVRKKSKKDFSTKYCKECATMVQNQQKHEWDNKNRKIRKS